MERAGQHASCLKGLFLSTLGFRDWRQASSDEDGWHFFWHHKGGERLNPQQSLSGLQQEQEQWDLLEVQAAWSISVAPSWCACPEVYAFFLVPEDPGTDHREGFV